MSTSNAGNPSGTLLLILQIVCWLGAGALSWQLIRPSEIVSVVLFILLWAVLGKVFSYAVSMIMGGITPRA